MCCDINRLITPRGKRATNQQKGALLTFLEENIDFAHDRFEGDAGAETQQLKWAEISTILNSLGGAKKNAEQWKQYWRDLKRNTKAKASAEKRLQEESRVNGFRKIKTLDEYEKRVVSIISLAVIDGDGESQQRGFGDTRTLSYSEVIDKDPPIQAEYLVMDDELVEIINAEQELQPETNSVKKIRTAPRKRNLKRPRVVKPTGESTAKLLAHEEKKLDFEREKFDFYKTIGLQKLDLDRRSTAALELIAEKLSSN